MRRFTLACLLAVLAGCSANSDSAPAGAPSGGAWNGQTGSLAPVCGLRPEQLTLKDSSRGFVVDTDGCTPGTGPGAVSLTGEDGESVDFSALSLGDGKYLIVPSGALEPGQYSVSVAGSTRTVTVEEPVTAPTPTRLGELEAIAPVNCGFHLALTLDPATIAFAPLMRLELSIDGRSSQYRDYGELTPDDGVVEIRCANNCAGPGRHLLEVSADIAGVTATLPNASASIDVQCVSNVEDNQGCSFSREPGSRFSALVVLVVLGLSAWRRSSARRVSREMKLGSSG